MLFAVTNSRLCREDFLTRMDKIASARPDRIIFREKQLSHTALCELAEKCSKICSKYSIPFSINSDIQAAQSLFADIHLPYSLFIKNYDKLGGFKAIGVSVHSAEEAVYTEQLGASYLIAGHIFATDCKKGLEPRGLKYLSEIVHSVAIPVLGIGGVTHDNVSDVMNTGAAGACVMSHLMICDDPDGEIRKIRFMLNADFGVDADASAYL